MACGATAAPLSIVVTAQSVPELSDLVGALISADLVNALSGPGPFTVFVPTNTPFEAIGRTSATHCPLNIEELAEVSEYHVVSGAATKSTDICPTCWQVTVVTVRAPAWRRAQAESGLWARRTL